MKVGVMHVLKLIGPLLCVVCILTGCSSRYEYRAETIDTVPVSGTLTFKGQPLEYYQVIFFPADGVRVAAGVTDANGKFSLGTNDGGDGAPSGICKVAVNFVGPPTTDAGGNEQIIDDPSKLPKPKVKIPSKYNDPEKSGLIQEVPATGLSDLKIDLL